MNGSREAQLLQAVDALLDARRTSTPIASLPVEIAPTSLDEAYAVQDAMAEVFGEIGGWKIGAPTPDATPIFAPMPLAWIGSDGAMLSGDRWRYRGLEAEIAFQLSADLPPRATPYTRDELFAALTCHPAIEVLESAYVDPAAVPREQMLADLQIHGGFVYGPSIAGWQHLDFTQESVSLAVDGVIRVERTGSNTSGDLLRLLPWLANEGASRTGGLRKGQWITTGSWTGNTLAGTSSVVDVTFTRAGSVSLRFG